MAEAVVSEINSSGVTVKSSQNDDENTLYRPHILEIFCLSFSGALLFLDVATDVAVCVEYWLTESEYWAVVTCSVIILSGIIVQIFSYKWLRSSRNFTLWHWISHFTLLGVMHRHASCIKAVLKINHTTSPFLTQSHCDELYLLNLFRTFLQSAPQVALQSYVCVLLPSSSIRGVSLAVSAISLLWFGLLYETALSNKSRFVSVTLKSSWYCAMLAARMAAILLFSVIFGLWTLVPLSIHWAAMTVWIISQKTEFCPTKLEELSYNVVIGFMYTFCFFNIREGRTRYRLMTFYTLMVTQNLASLLLFMLASDLAMQRTVWAVVMSVCVVAGTVIGLCSMIAYYRWFHPNGPIKWKNFVEDEMELNNKDSASLAVRPSNAKIPLSVTTKKSLKTRFKQINETTSENRSAPLDTKINLHPDLERTDKKILLDHWIARAGTPTFVSAPVGSSSNADTSIEFHTINTTPSTSNTTINSETKSLKIKNRRWKGFCSPTEINLKQSIDQLQTSDISAGSLTLKKRRGICSSDELQANSAQSNKPDKSMKSIDRGSELSQDTDSSNKKTSSDSIDMDLELSFSDINSSDINEFNENIVQKLCLSTLKNIKVGNQDADIQNIQRIALDILKEMYVKKGKHRKIKAQDALIAVKRDVDTPTEMLSVHDYENICAVNIAREAWGLRSWNVYSDIENWQHDGSVVRDRRRDTLTSASSEISSCISQELRQQILLAAANNPRSHTYSNILVDRLDEDTATVLRLRDERNTNKDYDHTFSAKLCHVDSAASQLEPILEEIDDFGDLEQTSKPRLNSESSLVATIDEIRKSTITNSPRNVYHRREHTWDSPQTNPQPKIETSLKRALWKEPSKFNQSNILKSLPEKENIHLEITDTKFLSPKVNERSVLRSLSEIAADKSPPQHSKITNLRSEMKRNTNKTDDVPDLSNTDIDLLWQLVSDRPLASTEDLTTSNITSSLQSLIQKDNATAPIVNIAPQVHKSNVKKNRPRRKFSLLREHFEPKNTKPDEKVLFKDLDTKQTASHGDPIFNVRFQNDFGHSSSNNSDELATVDSCDIQKQVDSVTVDDTNSRTIKEKRTIFLKQVLSPPKFSTKIKQKT